MYFTNFNQNFKAYLLNFNLSFIKVKWEHSYLKNIVYLKFIFVYKFITLFVIHCFDFINFHFLFQLFFDSLLTAKFFILIILNYQEFTKAFIFGFYNHFIIICILPNFYYNFDLNYFSFI